MMAPPTAERTTTGQGGVFHMNSSRKAPAARYRAGRPARACLRSPSSIANQFLVKFAHFRPGDRKRIAALAGRAVVTAGAAAHALGPGFEVALALQPMQHRIERSRADPVTVLA